MGKKRSNEDLASDTSAKKEKLEEFNGTMFKTMLKEGTTVRKGEQKDFSDFVFSLSP